MQEIPLFKIYSDTEDIKAVSRVIASGRNWATGEFVPKFEKAVASYVGMPYAVSFSSGTSALHALMIAYGIGPGDEVIVPSFTFIATANAPLFTGAKPVFAEIEEETYGLDPEDVERKITKRTKAIMPVHFGGDPCKIRELKRVAKKHKLLLIEDAAESLGTKAGDRYAGTFGDAAMFSFCAPKVATIGEGGIVVTRSRELAEQLKLLRSHGRAETGDYFSSAALFDYVQLGYNWRLSNILAALGVSQMKKLNKLIRMRRRNAALLSRKLKDVPGIRLPGGATGSHHIFQMYTIFVEGGKRKRDLLKKRLNEEGIGAKVYFPLVHLSKFYRSMGWKKGDLPATERIGEHVLTLPMYPGLKESEVEFMAKEVKKVFHE